MSKKSAGDWNHIARNKKAYRDYHILDKFEAGLALRGTEVKSLRARNVAFADSFAHFRGSELFLLNLDIPPYTHGNINNHDPKRPRKLLLHRSELKRLSKMVKERGLTVVPLRLYFNSRGYVKVELGLAKGKAHHDKREDIRKKDMERDLRRRGL